MSETRWERLARIRDAARPGELWDLGGYDIDRDDVEWVIADATDAGAAVGALGDLVKRYDEALSGLIDMHAQVAMDTPEDVALHESAVTTVRGYRDRLRDVFVAIAREHLGGAS